VAPTKPGAQLFDFGRFSASHVLEVFSFSIAAGHYDYLSARRPKVHWTGHGPLSAFWGGP
jgi:hypothetical protein